MIRHRKVVDLSQRLRIPPAHALGVLHALWHAAMEQQEDGDLSLWSDDLIAELACAPRIGASQFVDHIRQSGWLDGHLLHDWIDYAGRYLESKYRSKQPQRLVAIWAKHGRLWDGRSVPGHTQDEPRSDPGRPTLPNPTNQPKTPPLPPQWDGFAKFWEAYPRKVGKAAAEKAWKRLKASPELLETLLRAVAAAKLTPGWIKDGGQFIPHASTWLNGRRWEDEVVPGKAGSGIPDAKDVLKRLGL